MATGTSIRGQQTVVSGAIGARREVAVRVTNQPLPPIRRLGYLYVYVNLPGGANPHWVIVDRLFRAPGAWLLIPFPPFDVNYRYRVDIVWEVPGIPWEALLI